jgi:hypothetical protein
MPSFRNKSLFCVTIIALAAACNPAAPQTPAASAPPKPTPTGIAPEHLPFLEVDAPRISVEDAKAAVDNGLAVIVDVRDTAAYERSHIAGALSIQLGEVETDAAGLPLDKEQWIITYCT